MMKFNLCKSCGNAYDADEIRDGYCLFCAPDEQTISIDDIGDLDLNEPGMRNIYEQDAE